MSALVIDLKNNAVSGPTLVPTASVSTNANLAGVAVDLANGTAFCSSVLSIGAVSGTSPTMDVKLQASTTTNTGWNDISGATFTQATTSNTFQIINFQLPADTRYVRCTGTVGGTLTSAVVSCTVYAHKKYVASTTTRQYGYDRSPST
jgi:hypothetical protein